MMDRSKTIFSGLAVLGAVFLAGCGTQTVISSKHQAVIEAGSHEDAVAAATAACAKYARTPLLTGQRGAGYWFNCMESEDEREAQTKTFYKEALQRAAQYRRVLNGEISAEQAIVSSSEKMEKAAAAMTKPETMMAEATETGTPQSSGTMAKSKAMAKKAETKVVRKQAKKADAGSWIQIGAFRRKRAAERFARRFRSGHPRLVGDHNVVVRKATLGRRGTFYRSQLGPFANRGAAMRVCRNLKNRGSGCFVLSMR